jgi:hypothetical protein
MHLAEKMARWGIDATTGHPSASHVPQPESEGYEHDDEDDFPSVPIEYAGLRSFLLESNEFEELSHNLELGLQAGKVDTWSKVRLSIAKELASLAKRPNDSTGRYSLSIDLPWSPRSFLREQYKHLPEIPDLGSVITLSGATGHVYAATAETYIRTTWPRYGTFVLCAVQNALKSSTHAHGINMGHSSLDFHIRHNSTKVIANGHPLFISSAAEILVWLSTSCRASAAPNRIQACRMHLGKGMESGTDLSFVAELETVE